MSEESLLTDELRAQIGRETQGQPVVVTLKAVQRAAEVYYGQPVKLDLNPGDEVPGYAIAALSTDGEDLAVEPPLPNSVLVSNEWLFERPLRLGETLLCRQRLGDIAERFGGQFGQSLHFRRETQYLDSTGTLVASSVNTLMYYDARNARRGGSE